MDTSLDPRRLADLVQRSSVADEDEAPEQGSPRAAPDADDLGGVSAELSALLAELARTPEVDVDVAEGWTPGVRPGDTVGRFLLRRELGRGGFGVVYEAFDRELGRAVAFKAIRPGRRGSGRGEAWLRSEAEAVARLNHPNIVTLHDFGSSPSGPFLIFELLRGETLAERLRSGPLPVREALRVGADVARVLAHAHRAGVVHRDLKPANVYLCGDGAVKVLDFGLAFLFGRGGPVSGGTPAYMAPEQWRSEPGDERTDVFALGVLLHQMISGVVPYRVTREGPHERSEALAPGPPPALPPGMAPAALRRLVARMLAKEPADRPQTAEEVLRELDGAARRMERRGRRSLTAAGAAVLVALLVVGLARRVGRPPLPLREDGRLLVAVADFENGTGEQELDGLSGLLVTSLEQSRTLEVLTRSRLLSLLRQIGKGDAARIDAAIAEELARAAGAQLVLAGSARRTGDAIALELRGLDPAGDRRIFSVRESAPAKAELFGAIDRLSDGVREVLREREEDIRASRIRVAQAITSSPEAYHAYFVGLDCMDRPSRSGSWVAVAGCAEHFRRALALDPTFAMAHYQIAFLLGTEQGSRPELETHMAAALRYSGRAPPKEATLIRAWAAHLGRRDEEALALYGKVLADFPDDAQAVYLSGDLQYHRGQPAAAVPFFEKALGLDPAAEWPLDHLVDALGVLRRHAALRDLAARLGTGVDTPARTHALVRALVWMGDAPGAVAVARAAHRAGGGAGAVQDLVGALAAAGDYREAERILRARIAEEPESGPARAALAIALRAQGRRDEGLRVLDDLGARRESPEDADLRATYLAGDGDARAVWREAVKASAVHPESAGFLAVLLALLGDVEHASRMGAGAPAGSAAREELEALALWRRGEPAEAVSRLAALEARDPWPTFGLAPAYLVAEIALSSGDDREAASAAARFRRLAPRGLWRGWAYPRSLYVSALAHARMGDGVKAREEVEALLSLWAQADPDLPLLAAARALRARLERR